MLLSRRWSGKLCRAARFCTAVAAVCWCGAAPAAEPKAVAPATSGSAAIGPEARDKLETEIDISGPYHAIIDDETFPSELEIWGPKAMLKIAMDGQDRPMLGMFVKDDLKVVSKYGAENFNLTTMVEAQYDGRNFVGRYSRADEKLGLKVAKIVLTPYWAGGGGAPVKMPLPRRPDDIPGRYGLTLKKDGAEITTQAAIAVEKGQIKMSAAGRLYTCDYGEKQITPLFWEGKRMDTFRLTPTETGFTGTLTKEIAGKEEQYEVNMGKAKGGGGGDDHHWTYVYDVIFANAPPVWIGKLTMHEDDARLVIELNDGKAAMKGSLVDGVLSATGDYGRMAVSIRAAQNPHGFAGAFRRGSGAAVQEMPVVLKSRPGRGFGPAW